MTTESQRYITVSSGMGGNAIPQHAGPEPRGHSPTIGLNLLWDRNPFRGNFNHWQVSRKEAGQIFFKRRHGCEKIIHIIYVCMYIYVYTNLYERRPLKQFTNCNGKFLEFDNA